jgi:hypothetical protein
MYRTSFITDSDEYIHTSRSLLYCTNLLGAAYFYTTFIRDIRTLLQIRQVAHLFHNGMALEITV